MIRFEHCQQPRLLVVHFEDELSQASLDRLNESLARYVASHGSADLVIDLSEAGVGSVRPVVERGMTASMVPDRRRAFVVANEAQYGLIRIYGAYQEAIGMTRPAICNSVGEALRLFDAEAATFEPWPH